MSAIVDPHKIKWLIWSHEHKAWWAPDRRGYVQHRDNAGRYDFNVAYDIVCDANLCLKTDPHEAIVPDVVYAETNKPAAKHHHELATGQPGETQESQVSSGGRTAR